MHLRRICHCILGGIFFRSLHLRKFCKPDLKASSMMRAYIFLIPSLPAEPHSCNILACNLFVYSQCPLNIYIHRRYLIALWPWDMSHSSLTSLRIHILVCFIHNPVCMCKYTHICKQIFILYILHIIMIATYNLKNESQWEKFLQVTNVLSFDTFPNWCFHLIVFVFVFNFI